MRAGSSKRDIPEGLAIVGLVTNRNMLSSPWIRRPLSARLSMPACGIRPFMERKATWSQREGRIGLG